MSWSLATAVESMYFYMKTAEFPMALMSNQNDILEMELFSK